LLRGPSPGLRRCNEFPERRPVLRRAARRG
jgi:hypothetical protein